MGGQTIPGKVILLAFGASTVPTPGTAALPSPMPFGVKSELPQRLDDFAAGTAPPYDSGAPEGIFGRIFGSHDSLLFRQEGLWLEPAGCVNIRPARLF